ncbi:MAG: endonuclease/exonuclease/phosphatase family protein [Pyrinomonadaceae bacterium]
MSSKELMALPSFIASAKVESGAGSVPPAQAINASSFIIASYNIRYAVGQFLIPTGLLRKVGYNFPQPRAERVAENIANAANAFASGSLLPRVDILALQEADKGTARSGLHHLARELAEQLDMSWVHVGAGIPRGIPPAPRQWWLDFEEQIGLHDEGDTGVALLSRVAMSDVVRIDLPWHECPWRPRLAMAVTIKADSQSLRLINAHVDPHAAVGGQLEQLEVLVDHANRFNGPSLILGDFNTLTRRKVLETCNYLESQGFTTPFRTGTPTWRGFGLRLHADWIFTRGVEIRRFGVARPLNVSDHWPIWAKITLPIGDCQLPNGQSLQ